jgi:hypothetical protein
MNQELQPQEYLDKYEITTYLKDVLVKVLEDKPEDPFQYIADYFKNVIQGANNLETVKSFGRHEHL